MVDFATEPAFDAASMALKNAQRAFDRSRTKKNRAALIAANEAFDVACQAFRDEQDAYENAVYDAEVAEAEVINAEIDGQQLSLAL